MNSDPGKQCVGVFRHGQIELDGPVDWPAGTRVVVRPLEDSNHTPPAPSGPVIIAGFGLGGRYVADLLDHGGIPYLVVEKNPVTVETQACLGRSIMLGDISTEQTLQEADIHKASLLALTIPDEQAVLQATSLARRLQPDIFIIARTTYTSSGIKASQLGADEVIKAEQAVALQFYDRLRRRLERTEPK